MQKRLLDIQEAFFLAAAAIKHAPKTQERFESSRKSSYLCRIMKYRLHYLTVLPAFLLLIMFKVIPFLRMGSLRWNNTPGAQSMIDAAAAIMQMNGSAVKAAVLRRALARFLAEKLGEVVRFLEAGLISDILNA